MFFRKEELKGKENPLEAIFVFEQIKSDFLLMMDLDEVYSYPEFAKSMDLFIVRLQSYFYFKANCDDRRILDEEFFKTLLENLKDSFVGDFVTVTDEIINKIDSYFENANNNDLINLLKENNVKQKDAAKILNYSTRYSSFTTSILNDVIEEKYTKILVEVIDRVYYAKMRENSKDGKLYSDELYREASREVLKKKLVDEAYFYQICVDRINPTNLSDDEKLFFVYYVIAQADIRDGSYKYTKETVCNMMKISETEFENYYTSLSNGFIGMNRV